MSFLASSDKISILHLCYATWNGARFLVGSSNRRIDGFELAYLPFSAGTSLTLALSSLPWIRVGHAFATIAVCAPHIWTELGAQIHGGSSLLYLVGHYYCKWRNEHRRGVPSNETNQRQTIPLAGRLLSGLLGLSQLGVSIYFTSNYIGNNPTVYEPFLVEMLTTTDHVPTTTLTQEFLRGTYLAGTYAVLGIGWSVSTCLVWEVMKNSAQGCKSALTSFTINLSTQVVLHSIGYLLGIGGEALGDYMYVHGPMSASVFAMIFGAHYLSSQHSNMDTDKEKKE